MKYGLYNFDLASWAAADVDWKPNVDDKTLVFPTERDALSFKRKYSELFEHADVAELPDPPEGWR